MNTLDERMAGRDFIVGDYSLADITYVPFFTREDHYKVAVGDDTPNLKRWRDSLLERPTVKSTP
jgi:GST-like protein